MQGIERQAHGAVAVLLLNRPPVNALSGALAAALSQALQDGLGDPAVRAIVLAGQGRGFSAGADIHGFDQPGSDPHALTLLVESASKPVVAALHGHVLGAGLELALACHLRVASAEARLGLPEIRLGLIPGAGGTQRLPRLVGAEAALAIMLSGSELQAHHARDLGLIDAIVEADLLEQACGLALDLADGSRPHRHLARQGPAVRLPTPMKAPPQPAEQAIHACVAAAMDKDLASGLALESQWFERCVQSPDSKAMRHAFAAERRSRFVPSLPTHLTPQPVQSATVVGAGTMGAGIALCMADKGITVDLVEPQEQGRHRAERAIQAHWRAALEKGRITHDEVLERQDRIRIRSDLSCAAGADLVIEAVFENMALKCEVFRQLDALCPEKALLATNTSSLDIDRIAQVTRRPDRVLGLHFFSPAPAMRLLEVVRAEHTSSQSLVDGLALARQLNKLAVVARVGPGFIGNRMVAPYARQAERLMLEGASPAQIDRALTRHGFAMGPLAVGDLVGLDIGVRAAAEDPRPRDPRDGAVARRLVAEGRLGQKSGAGFYRYEPGSRMAVDDPSVSALIAQEARRLGVNQRVIHDDEIVERCMLALIREGAMVLEEGIALRAGDVDVVWLNGYGFPRRLGGPMYQADVMGLPIVLQRLIKWARHDPLDAALWRPPGLIERLAREGRRFADLDAAL
jgi:3-hydroxyacyl-CoA dehydrogenase